MATSIANLVVALTILVVFNLSNAIPTVGIGKRSNSVCVEPSMYNISNHEDVTAACSLADGYTVSAGETFYWWEDAVDEKTLVYHVNNTCATSILVRDDYCEEMMETVYIDCQSNDEYTAGATTGCDHYGMTVVGPYDNYTLDSGLGRRDDPGLITCLTGGPDTPTSELFTVINNVCGAASGTALGARGSILWFIAASTGVLEFNITNFGGDTVLDGQTCVYELQSLVNYCAGGTNSFYEGWIGNNDIYWFLTLYPEKASALVRRQISNTHEKTSALAHRQISNTHEKTSALAHRQISNTTQCFSGNASAPVSEMIDIVNDSLCPFFVNSTLVPQESYKFDYYIPEGDLVFELLNICKQNVKLDNNTCIAGFDMISTTCTTCEDQFVNGTVDNQCIRLNTWVNATRLSTNATEKRQVTSITSSPLGQYPRNDNPILASIDQLENGAPVYTRDLPAGCPADATSPYTANITTDVFTVINDFCTRLAPFVLLPHLTVTNSVPLPNYPADGPVTFTTSNSCGANVLIDESACIRILGANVVSDFNSCEFIAGQGADLLCQSYSMLVGTI